MTCSDQRQKEYEKEQQEKDKGGLSTANATQLMVETTAPNGKSWNPQHL